MDSAPSLSFRPRGLYIGGSWTSATDDRTFVSIDPSTGEVLAEVPYASATDVDRAVAAARAASEGWRRTPLVERAQAVRALAERIRGAVEELALIDCRDSGNTIKGMRSDVRWTADTLDYFAGLATEMKGETFSRQHGHLNLTWRQPYGVVGKISPFNHPFRFTAEKLAAPLIAGNTVVLKSSEQAPISSLRLGELVDGLFPAGVVNIVTGDAVAGEALVRHPDVPRIGFIGSVPSGRAVALAGADRLKHISLELGGKNAIIIFPDADPAAAASAVITGMNLNRQGQSCSSTSRVLVHASLLDAVTDELVRRVRTLPVGLPWLDETELGPIVSERQYRRVLGYIEAGVADGATLLTGGGAPTDPALAAGYFVEPTVFGGVDRSMRIATDEIFGPVMALMSWTTLDEAIDIANDVEFGLTASIVTGDLASAMEATERIDVGYVWVNSAGRYHGAPYGGWKQSGIGQEEGLEELLSHTQVKNVNLRWDRARSV